MMKPLTPGQKAIAYFSLASVLLCTAMGVVIIWLMVTNEL